jgi:hypothetical protein
VTGTLSSIFKTRGTLPTFRAGTQYGDFDGSAAADGDMGLTSVESKLVDRGLIKEDESVVAIDLYVSQGFTYIKAFVIDGYLNSQTMPTPLPVREVDLPISHEDFFGLFKRFSVVLTQKNANLHDHEYITRD